MTLRQTYRQLTDRLTPIYGIDEAEAIARRLMEDGHGIQRIDLMMDPNRELSKETTESLGRQLLELEQARPVQYIVGFEEFMERRFDVDESVLIPRQETEELVRKIISESTRRERILDIGTGSGAIAISLALEISDSVVEGWDISSKALDVAVRNAQNHGANVQFREVDILQVFDIEEEAGRKWDVVVSNPPYVLESEKESMRANVLEHEPHTALFVEDSDPLIFYEAITRYASMNLRQGGRLYFEINQRFGKETAALMTNEFGQIEILQDIHGVDRMVCGVKR